MASRLGGALRTASGRVAALIVASVATGLPQQTRGGSSIPSLTPDARGHNGAFHPEEWVNTLGGTDSSPSLSHGNVLPAVVRPWGMNAWVPQTSSRDAFFFSGPSLPGGSRSSFFGVRCTHQPSPWVNDYGPFLIAPSAGEQAIDPDAQFFARYDLLRTSHLHFDMDESTWRPYYWNASLSGLCQGDVKVGVELTATSRAAAIRFHFGPACSRSWHRISILLAGPEDQATAMAPNRSDGKAGFLIVGQSRVQHGGVPFGRRSASGSAHGKRAGTSFRHFFHATVQGSRNESRDFVVQGATVAAPASALPGTVDTLTLRVATSFVSAEQAEVNYDRELGHRGAEKSFEDLVLEAKEEWRLTLGNLAVHDLGSGYSPEEERGLLEVFYSSLYRAVQFPRLVEEVTKDGQVVHFSPFDPSGRVWPGAVSVDSGFWDAYRTVYPLLSVAYPQQLGRLVEGWLNAWREGKWLPNWASPGYRGNMPGSTMGDAVLADAIVKGLPGFNRTAAYLAASQDAFQEPPAFALTGRKALREYRRLGYVPADPDSPEAGDAVSLTLNFMVADHALASAAAVLGRPPEEVQQLRARSMRYNTLFDPKSGFFRPKLRSGSFAPGFKEYAWGNGYTEGGPWQYRFAVPYDAQGLAELYRSAGLDLCDKLEELNTGPSTVDIGNGGRVLHEMTEMRRSCWGQYAHNNQPVHDALYMFIAAGRFANDTRCSQRGMYWLRKVMTELYRPGPAMFPGDEDNGEMGAWFVLSALGLYQLEPGSSSFLLGTPLFANVTLSLEPGGQRLRIEAVGNGKGHSGSVESVSFNGKMLETLELPYTALRQGGVLQFHMSPQAEAERGTRRKASAPAPGGHKGARDHKGPQGSTTSSRSRVALLHRPGLRTRA